MYMIANDDASVSFTRIPNSVLEWVLGPEHDLSFRQVRVLLTVFRFTYGFSRRSAFLSSPFVARLTGVSQPDVSRAFTALVEAGLLTVSKGKRASFYTLVPRRYKNKENHMPEPYSYGELTYDEPDTTLCYGESPYNPMVNCHRINKETKKEDSGAILREFTAEELEELGGHVPVEQPEPVRADDQFANLW